ncbi:SH3 domain-containing protein [Shimia sp. NS0008-38b]|uniref:SH3 domain-containing protein n=1 Tax=Shimia sp. NS0008-38b TaxID=3127653 RepID=UPI003342333D
MPEVTAKATQADSTVTSLTSEASVPIVKASLSHNTANLVGVPSNDATTAKPVVQNTGAEILVASLAGGAESFATPGAPLFTITPAITTTQDATLELSTATNSSTDQRIVRGSRVNMRGGPGTSFGVITVLTQGQEVQVLRESGGWVKLKETTSGRIGWMSAKMLMPQQATSEN